MAPLTLNNLKVLIKVCFYLIRHCHEPSVGLVAEVGPDESAAERVKPFLQVSACLTDVR